MKSNFAIWLAVNEDGDAAVSLDGADEALDTLKEEFGGNVTRVAKLAVAMALPSVPEVEADVPGEDDIEAEAA